MRELIPRQMFDIRHPAAIGNHDHRPQHRQRHCVKTSPPKCYGGDVSRKKKLLNKQKEGKKRMKSPRPCGRAARGLPRHSPTSERITDGNTFLILPSSPC